MSEKKTHDEVDYSQESSDPEQRCGTCRNYHAGRFELLSDGNIYRAATCDLVEGPIYKNGICSNWERRLFKVL